MKKMKSTFQTLAVLCLIGFLAFACSSDDNGSGNHFKEGITFKKDGDYYETSTATFAFVYDGVIFITGAAGDYGTSYSINMGLSDNKVGTYPISSDYLNSIIIAENTETADGDTEMTGMWHAANGIESSGEIVLTSITDTHVQGTFHCIAQSQDDGSTIHITEGTFNIKINSLPGF